MVISSLGFGNSLYDLLIVSKAHLSKISYWLEFIIFKLIILELIEKRISEIVMTICSFEEKLKTQKFDMILTLDDSQLFERSVIFSCKKNNIPIIMIQNGDLWWKNLKNIQNFYHN